MGDYLLLYYQPGAGWLEASIDANPFTIGSAPHNHLVLRDPLIAPEHAQIYISENGIFVLERLVSFPVWINSRRIATNKWIPLPPENEFSLGSATLRVNVRARAHQAGQRPPKPTTAPRRSPVLWLSLLGGLFAFACLAVGVIFGWNYFRHQAGAEKSAGSDQGAGVQAAEPTLAPAKVINVLAAVPGGEITDGAGASLTLPVQVVSGTQSAELAVLQPGGELAAEIEKFYTIDSLAYAVQSPQSTGAGRPLLKLPAPSPDARLAVLVDGRYFGVLDEAPQGGVFSVEPFLAAPGAPSDYPAAERSEQATQYLVVTPRQAASTEPASGARHAYRLAQAAGGAACVAERFTLNHCWRNAEKSVYVFWTDDYPASLKNQEYLRVEDTINAVAAIMKAYKGKGYTYADISSSYRVDIVMDTSVSEPFYSPRSHNIYLPWDIAANAGTLEGRCTLAHELFHWIQDEQYRMITAYYSHSKAWWLDVSAEVASFSLDTACIQKNLLAYGKLETEEGILAFQSKPQIWMGKDEQARYIHAQQLYLSVCSGGVNCALSESDFVQAINAGTYPLDGSTIGRYQSAAIDLAGYLLGDAPVFARSDAFIPPAALKGKNYGDYMIVNLTTKGSSYDSGLTLGNFQTPSPQELRVETRIQPGGVYPLWVGNGVGSPYADTRTGLPVLLTVEAGAPFLAKVDDQQAELYDGKGQVNFGVISDQLGHGLVRLAAYSQSKEDTFRASLKPLDLSGDWLSSKLEGSVSSFVCDSEDLSVGKPIDPGEGFDQILSIVSGYGTFVLDSTVADQSHYIWQATSSLPDNASIEAEITVKPEEVELEYLIDIPRQVSLWPSSTTLAGLLPPQAPDRPLDSPLRSLPGWLAMGLFGAALLVTKRHPAAARRLAPLLLLLVVSTSLLAGCFGLSLYGQIKGQYTFKEIEVIDPLKNPYGNDQYRFRLSEGSGKLEIDLTLIVVTMEDDKEVTTESPCQVTFAVQPEVFIGPEGLVQPPSDEP